MGASPLRRALLRGVSIKASDVLRFLAALALMALFLGVVFVRVVRHLEAEKSPPPPARPPPAAARKSLEACAGPADRTQAAEANRASLETLAWTPFGRPEAGWATYGALVAREVGSGCGADTPGFAAAYARWQAAQGFSPDGVFKPDEFARMETAMELRRPFAQLTAKGVCPAAPDESRLQAAAPEEGYGRKIVSLRPGALAAYRRMAAAARAAGVASDPDDFKLVSGFRGPAEEAARCAGGDCNTVTKARCSAHRTGLAADLYLGRAAGSDPVSTAEDNRRAITRTRAYRWLVANADRFGFLNYPYEPWHWEWTGEPP
jgi:hypothetical protein